LIVHDGAHERSETADIPNIRRRAVRDQTFQLSDLTVACTRHQRRCVVRHGLRHGRAFASFPRTLIATLRRRRNGSDATAASDPGRSGRLAGERTTGAVARFASGVAVFGDPRDDISMSRSPTRVPR
jgi:hypothetical protein